MGSRGYLWIINATSKALLRTNQTNNRMNVWSFTDIPSQSMKMFIIEFSPPSKDVTESGEADFQIEGTSNTFKLLILWPDGLKVDWSSTDTTKDYVVFPPSESSIGQLGWIQNGYLSLIVLEKGVKTVISTILPGNDSIIGKNSTIPYPITSIYKTWMEYYSDVLGQLTLTEMTIPGTHDSGTYKPVNKLSVYWNKTQNLSLSEQLVAGIRSLDLRIGQVSPGNYIICHDVWKMSYSLAEALREVTDFIDATSREIVVLDFHRFVVVEGSKEYDFDQLKSQIKTYLDGYCLPVNEGEGKPLSDIWPTCGKKRIVVAWNASSPDDYMWKGVNQVWYSTADTQQKLYSGIRSTMLSPPSGLWSVCSFVTSSITRTPESNAIDLDPTVTRWYFGGSTFCQNGNIINVDFFEKYSNVVQAAIVGSLLKGGNSFAVS